MVIDTEVVHGQQPRAKAAPERVPLRTTEGESAAAAANVAKCYTEAVLMAAAAALKMPRGRSTSGQRWSWAGPLTAQQ